YRPAPRPARSTNAWILSLRNALSGSRAPRTVMRTSEGVTCARRPEPRFRQRTSTLLSCRSTGAGQTSTTTVADCGIDNRTDGSDTPIVTTSRTRVRESDTDTGSVVAFAICRMRVSGPTTSTVDGSDDTRPTTYPGEGSPSTAGITGTMRFADC